MKKTKGLRSLIVRRFVSFSTILIFFISILFVFQRDMIFPGVTLSEPENFELSRYPFIKEEIFVTPNVKSKVWISGDLDGDSPVVFYFHGNYDLIHYNIDMIEMYKEWGYNTILIEYPGYGASEGQMTLQNMMGLFNAVYDKYITNQKVVIHGRSIGTGIALSASESRRVDTLLLESGFLNITDGFYGLRILEPLLLDNFKNKENILNFEGDILVYHGETDEVFSYEIGEKIYALSESRGKGKNKFLSTKLGHNDFVRPMIEDDIGDFLK